MRAMIAVVLIALLFAVSSARALTINVTSTPYSADRTGVLDCTGAFASAITALENNGGGTLYCPAGKYLFQTAPSGVNINIRVPGIRIMGDAVGDTASFQTITGSGFTGTTFVSSTDTDVIYIYDPSGGGPGARMPPNNTIIENIRITRFASGQNSVGVGIKIDTNNQSQGFRTISGCVIRNVIVDHMYAGISTTNSARGVAVRQVLASFTVEGCILRDNKNDGMYVEEFSNLKVTKSEFTKNGFNGLYLHPYYGAIGPDPVGGAFIENCVMSGNGDMATFNGAGLICRGEQTIPAGNQIKDVHVAACQMSGNAAQGFNVTEATNLEVATCTISGNLGATGNNVGHCTGVSIIGCTFKANAQRGLQLSGGSSGVSVASCTFVGNSAASAGANYALVVTNGATFHSYSNLTFLISGTQTLGIVFSGNGTSALDPTGMLMQGINFDKGMTAVFSESNLSGTQKYRLDFLSPQNWTAATPPSTYHPGNVLQYIQK